MDNIWIYVINRDVFVAWQNFNVGYYTQTVQLNCFIPAIHKDTSDHCSFILLSVILTLAEGHKISGR